MLEFLWPWVFVLAPLPWVLRRLLPAAKHRDLALNVSFLDELKTLTVRPGQQPFRHWRRHGLLAALWLPLLLAAARPQWLEPFPTQPITGRDLLIAVDYSGSMDITDMYWRGQPVSRLALVKQLMGDFIENRRGDRIGLILFGSNAYLQAPLTFDRHTVATWLQEAPLGIAGQNTALGDAIGLAVKRLQDNPADQRVLLLITDGADNGSHIPPSIAAQLAADQHIRIYCIGVGSDPRATGRQPSYQAGIDLDEPLLEDIARSTGGRYFRARSQQELQAIGAALDRLEPGLQEDTPALLGHPLYPWPLGLALAVSIGWALVHLRTRRLASSPGDAL